MFRALLLTALLLLPETLLAQTQAFVEPGEREKITAHGVCRQVTNGNGNAVMIPLSSPGEWSEGGAAFLAAPRSGMTVENCTRDIWVWELMRAFVVRYQGPTMFLTEAGGLEIQTRFTQYTSADSTYSIQPLCGPVNGGERISIVTGTATFQRHFIYVCNNATPVDPFSFPNVTVAASGYWTSPEVTLSGIPHTRTEALVVGVLGSAWSDPNGGCCSFNYDSGVLVNGRGVYSGYGLGLGLTTSDSPYRQDYLSAYEPAASTAGQNFAVAVRNGDRIQLRMRATRDPGVTITYFVKIGQHITYFTVTTT